MSNWYAAFISRIRSEFVQQVGATIGNRLLQLAIGLATSVLVTRSLGPEGRGQYAVAATISAIGIQLGNLGLHASNTWAVARQPRLLGALIANSMLASVFLGGLGALVGWVVIAWMPGVSPLPTNLLMLALMSLPFGLAYLLLQNLLLGTGRIRSYNLLDLGTKIVSVPLLLTLVVAGALTAFSAFAVAIASLVAAMLAALVMLVRGADGPVWPRLNLLGEHGRYGLKAYVGALVSFLVLRIDLLLVQYIRGSEDAGYYAIAVALIDMVYMLPVVVGTLLFPRLSAMKAGPEPWRIARNVAMALSGAMIVLSLVAGLIAEPAITILFGHVFKPAVLPFVWLLPGIVLLSVHTTVMNYFAATGMPSVTVYAPVVGLALNIGLNIWLIPTQGIIGASIASTAAYGLMLAISGSYFLAHGRRFGGTGLSR